MAPSRTARVSGPWVYGVRAAPNEDAATQALERLSNAITELKVSPSSQTQPSSPEATEPEAGTEQTAEPGVAEH